jgi:hypothetical protein
VKIVDVMDGFEMHKEKPIAREMNDEEVMVDVENDQDNDEKIILLKHSGSIHANSNGVFLADAQLLGITDG